MDGLVLKSKKIIIIGGGLAGLSAGVFARKRGFEVQIFEHHSLPGGVCTAWKRDGFLIDGCIHWLMGTKPDTPFYRLYEELGVVGAVHFKPIHLYGRFRYGDTTSDIVADLDELERQWLSIGPNDVLVIKEILKGIRAFRGMKTAWGKPMDRMGLFEKLRFLWLIRRQVPYFVRYGIEAKKFAERIQSPALRWQISNAFVPEMPMAFLFMMLGQLADGSLATVEEGSLRFAIAIAKRFGKLGGKISFNSTVIKILTKEMKNGMMRAIGVRLADGSEQFGDYVISAADGYSTLFEMLDERFIDAKLKKRYDEWNIFPPILLVSFGVGRTFPGEPSMQMIKLPDSDDDFCLRIFNNNPSFATAGKTVIQVICSSPFEYWDNLIKSDTQKYNIEKKRVADQVAKHLDVLYPGILSKIEMTDVATPCTFVNYTRNHRGAWEGWLMTPEVFKGSMSKTLPGLDRFAMAGQWVEPGGGVPMVLLSGRNVMNIVDHELSL